MNINERNEDIFHARRCRCWIDGDAIYVGPGCEHIGHRVTPKPVSRMLDSLRALKYRRVTGRDPWSK